MLTEDGPKGVNFRTTVPRSSPLLTRPLAQVQSKLGRRHPRTYPLGASTRLSAGAALWARARGTPQRGSAPYCASTPTIPCLGPMFVTSCRAEDGIPQARPGGGRAHMPAPTCNSMPRDAPRPARGRAVVCYCRGQLPPTRGASQPSIPGYVLGGTAPLPRGWAIIHI